MEEFWKSIEGYEGLYEVSNLGRVRAVDKLIKQQGRVQLYRGCILSLFKNKSGYYAVRLSKNNKKRGFTVHRLVAKAFIPNPQNLPCVNHKDETQTNNTVFINSDGSINPDKSNLEWCTHSYNMSYGTLPLRKRMDFGERVCMYDKNGKLIKIFLSLHEAEDDTGVSHNTISDNCHGILHSAGGYIWRFFKDTEGKDVIPTNGKNSPRRICQYDSNLKLIATYKSSREAERITGVKHENIGACCRGSSVSCKGFYWCFEGAPTPKKKRFRPIAKYDLQMNLIETFDTLEEAYNSIGGKSKRAGIKQCLYGKNKQAYGFVWKEIKD